MASDETWGECWVRLRYTFAEYQPDKLISDDPAEREAYEENYRDLLYECSDQMLLAAVKRVCQTHRRWWPLPGVVNAAILDLREEGRSRQPPVETVPLLADIPAGGLPAPDDDGLVTMGPWRVTPRQAEVNRRGLARLRAKIEGLRARDAALGLTGRYPLSAALGESGDMKRRHRTEQAVREHKRLGRDYWRPGPDD